MGLLGKLRIEHRLPAPGAGGQGLPQGLDVEAAHGVEEGEQPQLGPQPHAVEQLVVLPELVGQEDHFAAIEEQVADEAQGMGHAAGDDRQREALAGQAGILAEQFLAPFLPQIGAARGGGVGQGLGGREVVEILHHRGQEHGLALLPRDADRGVVALGLVLGLGALGQDALGEEEPLAQFGEHAVDVRVLALDRFVEFLGQGADLRAGLQERDRRPQPLPQTFQLVPQGPRETRAELLEEAGHVLGLGIPIAAVHGEELFQVLRGKIEAVEIEAFRAWARSRWASAWRRRRRGNGRGSTRSRGGSRRSPARGTCRSRRCGTS